MSYNEYRENELHARAIIGLFFALDKRLIWSKEQFPSLTDAECLSISKDFMKCPEAKYPFLYRFIRDNFPKEANDTTTVAP